VRNIGMDRIAAHDQELGRYLFGELAKIPGVRVYGPPTFAGRIPVLTFNIGSAREKNYEQVARDLDARGFSVRDGCFCVHIGMPLLMGIPEKVHEIRTRLLLEGITDDAEGYARISESGYQRRLGPFMERFGIMPGTEEQHKMLTLPGAVRASPAFYNTLDEAYRFVTAVREIARAFH
jgi:selenocysteine lyase/cysteine desulfurase